MSTGAAAPEPDGNAAFPLLAAQRTAFLGACGAAEPAAFVTGQLTHLPPGSDPDAFRAAARAVVAGTEALRLRVLDQGRQVVLPPGADPQIPLHDVSGTPDPEGAALAFCRAALARPMDLAAGPPFAWALLRLGAGRLAWFQAYHHAAVDATGRDLVVARLARTYGAAPGAGEGDAPGALRRLQAEEAAHLASPRAAEDAAWALGQCTGRPEPPSPAGKPPGEDLLALRATRRVSPAAAGALRAAAAGAGATLPQLLLAAWAAVLARLSGREDVLLGFQVAGRRPASRDVPAMLTNEVPVRLAVPPDGPFAVLVALARRQASAALRHQHHPHAELRRALGIRPFDADPLDLTFNVLPTRAPAAIGGAPLRTRNLSHGAVRDLSLAVEQEGDGALILDLDTNRARYAPEEAEAVLGRLETVLGALAADPVLAAGPTGDLPMMGVDEAALVSHRFPDGGPASATVTVAALLAARMAAQPDAPALRAGGTVWRYGELSARANRLARHLLARGLRPGDIVALALPRCPGTVVAFAACALAGIGACPLDLSHAPERRDAMLAACGARGAIGLPGDPHRPPGLPWIAPEDPATAAAIAALSGAPLGDAERGVPVGPDAPAYVAFTSGSTGRPKGVAIGQGAIAMLAEGLGRRYDLGPGHGVVCVCALTFDVGLSDLYMAFAAGAELILLDDAGVRDPAAIRDACRSHPLPLMQATPSLWRTLDLEALPVSLAAVLGGEGFAADLLPRLRRFRAVFNAYGPTEATVWCAVHAVGPGDAAPVPVGRPLPGYRTWVADPAGRLLPVGAVGELRIGGPGVAAGYLGEPELTAAAFVAAPDGGRAYRTGDRARWRPDGLLEVLGRADGQIKVTGYRIEPGEVEHAILAKPWAAEAAVAAQGEAGRQRLVAYVVPAPGCAVPPAAAARAELAARLPPWMMPAAIVAVPAIPRTTAGKADRRALPEPPAEGTGEAPFAPSSPLEAALRGLFGRLCGRPVGLHDDFFEAGGDSLGAMVLLTELSQMGHAVALPTFVRAPTPAGLARAIAGGEGGEAVCPALPRAFLVPGIGGDEPDLAGFRAACAGEVRLDLLAYPDWAEALEPGYGIAALAGDLAARAMAAQPEGPILLAGHSMGGLAALAAASALAAGGRRVAGVLLLDSASEGQILPATRLGRLLEAWGYAAAYTVDAVREGVLPRKLASQVGRWLARGRRPRLLPLLARLRGRRLPASLRYALRRAVSWELHAKAIRPWRDRRFADPALPAGVPVILFKAAEAGAPGGFGWEPLVPGLRVVEVGGGHSSMLRLRGPDSLAGRVVREVRALAGAVAAP